MGKRVSGTPRRPRNPVARAVRTPLYRQRVVPDKRVGPPAKKEIDEQLLETGETVREKDELGRDGPDEGGADV